MEPPSTRPGRALDESTPEAMLDALRGHPEWDDRRRDEHFDRLIQRFPIDQLAEAARPRLGDLSGGDAEALLRIVEADGSPEMLRSLAEALRAQPDLPPERAWEALSLLQGSGLIEGFPDLAERWEELSEAIDDDGTLAELAEQLEQDPDSACIALQGLAAVEPAVRAEIVAGLAGQPAGPGLVEFLRLLAFSHEPASRDAALDALGSLPGDRPEVASAWAAIARDHPDPGVAERARRRHGEITGTGLAIAPVLSPRLRRGLVTSLDARGRGHVVLVAEDRGDWVASAFHCDVMGGIGDAVGQVAATEGGLGEFVAEFAARPDRDAVEGAPGLALGLLAGCLLLCGPSAPPTLRYWLERTAGPGFRPAPFPDVSADREDDDPIDGDDRADAVLDAVAGWVDDSDLTYDLAEEILLREGGGVPDPRRDSGAFRYLFEHRLQGRLELYRRMLLWMAAFWKACEATDLSRAARAMAGQLIDPQHAVPGHPFLVGLSRRSLASAQEELRRQAESGVPGVPG